VVLLPVAKQDTRHFGSALYRSPAAAIRTDSRPFHCDERQTILSKKEKKS